MNQDVVALALTTFGELVECLDIVPGMSQMPHGTSRSGSSNMRLRSGKPQSDTCIPSVVPAIQMNSSPMLIVKPAEPISFYTCI